MTMTDETTNPEPEIVTTPEGTAEDASASDLAALQAQVAEAAKGVLAGVPEHLRALIPSTLPPAEQIAWFNQAKATGVFDKPKVPATNAAAKPAITPQTPDHSSLPVHARLSAGYAN
jgi:hypothetical protein